MVLVKKLLVEHIQLFGGSENKVGFFWMCCKKY